ncbi:Aspartyl/asparaginyl beta-hydroxylase [Anabarilius grahami]|uniref:Aspartyl/asparaginyl beta-hydroxylase n=1 Tax=Anabarilius grahami TaxID=495550 RepID=A0A3N0YEF9_ANAGA|nr:Aspartyl/asparaginyl beta-hydroxylase [Anabarilius grahami]
MGEPNAEVKVVNEETEAKPQLAHKNGKKAEVGGGTSFFTWFMVLALLGVWTSVAVVYFDLVDYQGVIGKLVSYDADGDGDFDVEDAKVLLGKCTDFNEILTRLFCMTDFGLTKDGSKENSDSLEEVLDILAEEGTDWFQGFFTFLYDVMSPFETLEDEETEAAAEDVAGASQTEGKFSYLDYIIKQSFSPELSHGKDVGLALREALKQQLTIIHERVEARKIAKLALAEVRNILAKEEEERTLNRIREESEAKAWERAEARLKEEGERIEKEDVEKAMERIRKEKEEREKLAESEEAKKTKKVEKDEVKEKPEVEKKSHEKPVVDDYDDVKKVEKDGKSKESKKAAAKKKL